jgi:hypothetical protein
LTLAGTAAAGGSEPLESSSQFMSTSMVWRRCGPVAGSGGGCFFVAGAGGGSERMSQDVSTSIVLRRTGPAGSELGRRFLGIPIQDTGREQGTPEGRDLEALR